MGRIHGAWKLTGSPLSSLVFRWTQPGVIRSVQSGTLTIAGGSATGTATITQIDTKNAVIYFGGMTTNDATTDGSRCYGRLDLTNSTTITGTRGSNPAGVMLLPFTVIDYYPGALRSVQYGTVAMGANASATATITAVDTTKAAVLFLGWSTTNVAAPNGQNTATVALTNKTTVTATMDLGNDATTVGFVVIEQY